MIECPKCGSKGEKSEGTSCRDDKRLLFCGECRHGFNVPRALTLRVTSTGTSGACQTRVVNAATGEPLRGVESARFTHAEVGDTPRLELTLLDFEIDALAEAGATVIRKADGPPALQIHANKRISPAAYENLRSSLAQFRNARILVLEEGMTLFQLIGDRWTPIDPRIVPAPAEVLENEGIRSE